MAILKTYGANFGFACPECNELLEQQQGDVLVHPVRRFGWWPLPIGRHKINCVNIGKRWRRPVQMIELKQL